MTSSSLSCFVCCRGQINSLRFRTLWSRLLLQSTTGVFFFFVWVFCVGGAIHVPKRDANHTLAGFFPLGGIHRWRTGTIMLSVASGIHYFAASIVATRLGLSCPRLGFFYCFLFCLGILLLNHGERSCPCSCLSLRPSFFAFHFCLTVIHIALLSNFFYLSFLHKVSHDGSSTAVIL